METWDTIRARRNVRQYTDQPIARADLERILDAGRRTASASNWQPWNFVVVTDRPQLVEAPFYQIPCRTRNATPRQALRLLPPLGDNPPPPL